MLLPVSEDATGAFLEPLDGLAIRISNYSQPRQSLLSEEEQREYVLKLLSLPDLPERLGSLLAQSSELLPEVTICVDGLTAKGTAIVGTSALPSLANVGKSLVNKAVCQTSLPSKPFTFLNNISCVLRPGRSTLLLGPPGAGKSLFLSILGDRVKNVKDLQISGTITYNGATKDCCIVQRSVGLITQQDLLIPYMTVEDTAKFAYDCLAPKSRRKFLSSEIESVIAAKKDVDLDVRVVGDEEEPGPGMSDIEFAKAIQKLAASGGKVQAVLAMLGLLRCAKTKVGSAEIRGVSGGERRRCSIAEILVGPQAVVFADQISNGMDSATTFNVIQFMVGAMRHMKKTCVAALLQPAPEVMYLFDDLMLLSDGHLLYHGPVHDALSWFSSLGFEKPPRKDPCSFLQEITVPIGQLTYASDSLLTATGMEAVAGKVRSSQAQSGAKLVFPLSLDKMSNAFYECNPSALATRAYLDEEKSKTTLQWPVKGLYDKAYAGKPHQLALAVYRRQRNLIRGQKAFFIARIVQALFMGALRGSMFWQIPQTYAGGRLVLACNTATVVFLSMLSTPQIVIVFTYKPVFIKQRDNFFYPPWSFAIALLLSQIPQSIMEAGIYSIVIYFMAGFSYSASYFFRFYLIAFMASTTLAALTRFIAFSLPTRVQAVATLSCVILINQVTNGFNILYNDIPKWLIWLYWLNPIQWSLSSLNVLELTSPHWSITSGNSTQTLGIQVLETFDMQTDVNWLYYSVAYLLGLLFLLTIASSFTLKWTQWPQPATAAEEEEEEEEKVRPNDGIAAEKECIEKIIFKTSDAASSFRAPSPTSFECTPVTVICRNLSYCVPTPKGVAPTPNATKPGTLQILTDITFMAKPARLTALMGGTGSGKTSLMDVVCGRKTIGYISGEVLVNGHPVNKASWSRLHGYVEQENLHSPQLTVEEALVFSASLRLPRDRQNPDAVKSAVVDALRITELTSLRGRVTGGLSSEALKRLSIAVELVADPAVLFLDEATTGLGAREAAIVIRALKSVAATGRTVMVTIHQPATDIFEAFDDLVLLKSGGRLMYFGPLGENSSEVISYFSSYDGIVPLTSGYNPATWMLEVTGSSSSTIFKAADIDFAKLYAQSSLYTFNTESINRLASEATASTDPEVSESKYASPSLHRLKMVVWKFNIIYWRTPHYNFTRLVLTFGVSFFYGLVYYKQGVLNANGTSIGSVQNVLGLFFSMSVFLGVFNANNVLPLLFSERPVYYREKAAGMYGPLPYSVATGIAELPYLLVQALLMVCISYWLCGFAAIAWKFFYFLLMFFTSLCIYTFMGEFMATVSPSNLMSVLIVSTMSQIWTILNGYLIPYSQIPVYWQWMNRITPATWIIYGLAASQLGDSEVPMTGIDGQPTTVSEFLESFFGYEYSFIWWAWLICFAFAAVFRVGVVAALKLFDFNER